MKVAIIGARGMNAAYSGIEKVLSELCPRLGRMGHEIHVFSETDDEDKVHQGVRVFRVPALHGKYTETISRACLASFRALAQDYDVINYVAIGSGMLSPIPRLFNKPVVVSIHGLDWKRDKWPWPARLALRLAERTIVSAADEVTVVSAELEKYFERAYGRKVAHIPNGTEIRAGAADPGLLAQFGLEPDKYIFFASRLVPEKGAHELIQAFQHVETELKLAIAGGGRYDLDYVESLKRLDTRGKCVFTGHVTGASLDALFKGAYLYTLPSHMEGLSLSLLEAVGYGQAALVSNIPENIEVVGDCGFQFPVGNVGELTRALQSLVCEAERVVEMRTRALDRAGKLYSWDRIAEQYSTIYTSVGRKQRLEANAQVERS